MIYEVYKVVDGEEYYEGKGDINLTWFTGSRCARPIHQHRLHGPDGTVLARVWEFIPAIADCR